MIIFVLDFNTSINVIHEKQVNDWTSMLSFFNAHALESKQHFFLSISRNGNKISIHLDDVQNEKKPARQLISIRVGLYDLYW
jgi:hypothetical protein